MKATVDDHRRFSTADLLRLQPISATTMRSPREIHPSYTDPTVKPTTTMNFGRMPKGLKNGSAACRSPLAQEEPVKTARENEDRLHADETVTVRRLHGDQRNRIAEEETATLPHKAEEAKTT